MDKSLDVENIGELLLDDEMSCSFAKTDADVVPLKDLKTDSDMYESETTDDVVSVDEKNVSYEIVKDSEATTLIEFTKKDDT